METKICNICETEKSIDEFLWRNKQKGLKHHSCRLCYKELRKKSYEKNRDYYLNKSSNRRKVINKWYKDYKNNKKCYFCDESESVCLDFHHIDEDTKNYNVSSMTRNTYSIDRIEEEMDKCIIICSNCHRKLHAGIIKF